MRKKTVAAVLLLLALVGVSYAFAGFAGIKLPKCSGQLCKDSGCSPDVLCVSGAHVKSCAEVCK